MFTSMHNKMSIELLNIHLNRVNSKLSPIIDYIEEDEFNNSLNDFANDIHSNPELLETKLPVLLYYIVL